MATKKPTAQADDGGIKVPAEPIELQRLRWDEIDIPIVGTTPLIFHKWSEKAKQMMRDKEQGKAKAKKPPKEPETERADATYWMPNGDGKRPGMKAAAFKIATVDATRYFEKDVSFELLKRVIRVHGEGPEQLVGIDGELHPIEDPVRLTGTSAELRYRNEIWPWRTTLRLRYLTAALTADALVALVDAGGAGGVGENRPSSPKSKGGTFGCYEVEG